MKNRTFSKMRQAFIIANNMALSGLWENVILTSIILTTDGIIGYAERDIRCQMV